MRIIIGVLAALLLLLQLQVWRQYGRVLELEQRLESQRSENRELAARNEALAAEVQDLKSGLDAVEERARSELGLIREGEEFYLVVDPEELPPKEAEALRERGPEPPGEADSDRGPRPADPPADG